MAGVWHLLQSLIQTAEVPELGPTRRAQTESAAALSPRFESVFKEAGVGRTEQDLIRSAVLLWHDDLDESHTISQSIESPDGSYVHGIMHRREPDYGNSKYWFRRVGKHATFSKLAEKAAVTIQKAEAKDLAARLIHRGEWDPFAFVDECERAARLPKQDPRVQVLREIQALEIRSLLEHFCGSTQG